MQPPADGEVHLWLVDVERFEPDGALSSDELARVQRLRRKEDQRRFVAARMSLRHILGSYVGAPPDSLGFSTRCLHCGEEHGKPRLTGAAGAPDIRFSTTHSGSLVVHAFSVGMEVGVDVEAAPGASGWREVSAQFFRDDERALLAAAPDEDEARRRFLSLWTQKEALLKLSGLGLAGPLDKVDAAQAAREGVEVRPLDLPPGYAGALAVEGRIERLSVFRVP